MPPVLVYSTTRSFFFDTHKEGHSGFMATRDPDNSSLVPLDSIFQSHIHLSMKRNTVATTAALHILSEETGSTKAIRTDGANTIVGGSVMSDASHTEVESGLGQTKMGYNHGDSRIRKKAWSGICRAKR
ncbi:hypothetical protein K435DRAFT_811462 [Dendrothele bispora CBS 962.96]|uniref:Uncharacterized protein n=1 Tax=Dendrothele bispora (strain CBS 962.96) TaxID=1314807 RepID=A0A4S8KT06_DENBC|nr:hypothetical protein K435DRAFT_811462 [Dendrothele bispora CBS 962.96]